MDTLLKEAVQAVEVLESGNLLNALALGNGNTNASSAIQQELEPIYVQEQRGNTNTQLWQWRPPAELPQPLGSLDLCFMLRTIDYQSMQTAPPSLQGQLGELSLCVNELRLSMSTSTQALYVYVHILTQLSVLFDNTNVKCRAYFHNQPSPNASSNLLGEHLQALVLVASRHYSAAIEMPDGEHKALFLDRATVAMEEACTLAQLAQSERYEAERRLRRWQYIKPPSSVSQHNVQEKAVRLEEFRREDTQRLRAFIKQELGGLAQLGAHTLLMQLQKNEMRARELERIVVEDLANSHTVVYDRLAPIHEAVLRDYDEIELQLQHKPQASLGLYARQRRLHWYTKQQYLLAAVDWNYYRQTIDADPEALGFGLRASVRLKALTERDVCPHIVQEVQVLVDEVEMELQGYSVLQAQAITPIEPFVQPVPTVPHAIHVEEAWRLYAQERPVAARALESLHGFYACCVEASQQVPLKRVNARDVDPSFSMSNQCMGAVLNDRYTTLLPWLLRRIREDGTILLDLEQVALLQLELEEVKRMMKVNGLFIGTTDG